MPTVSDSKADLTIYDAADTKSLIKLIIRELALDDKLYKASSIASTISNAKNAMMTPEQYAANYGDQDRKALPRHDFPHLQKCTASAARRPTRWTSTIFSSIQISC